MGEALQVPWLQEQCSHVKGRVRDHKGSGLSKVPAPGLPQHSLLRWQGWRKPPAPALENGARRLERGRQQKRGGGSTQLPALPFFSHSLFGRQPAGLSPPFAGSSCGPDPAPHPAGGTARLPRGCSPQEPAWATRGPAPPRNLPRGPEM